MVLKQPILKFTTLAIVLFIIVNNLIFLPSNILCWDVFGNYLYLPLTFIYRDLALRDVSVVHAILEQYENSATFYQAMQLPDGSHVMKYTMGFSILYAPFFFIGHAVARITGFAADGFSAPYQYAILAGGIIYSILGIVVLSKVLARFFNERVASLVLLIVVGSTNYIIHVTMHGQNANSHNYLFLAYALILWFTIRWHESQQWKHMVPLAVVSGLAILSRPSEVVCLALPFFWGISDRKSFLHKIKLLTSNYAQVLTFILILLLIGSFQFTYWKIHTGRFLFNSYGGNPGEGFEFFRPHILHVLFSFRKGWLIYTPVMIFALAGFIPIYKLNRGLFTPLLLYFLFNLYIVSSWSAWWYAQSFGQRAMIPSYPVLALSLGYFLVWLFSQKRVVRAAGYGVLALLLLLNVFQTIQYSNGTLHGDRMTRKYYTATFGKLHASEADRELLLVDRSFDTSEAFTDPEQYHERMLARLDFEEEGNGKGGPSCSGARSFLLDSSRMYSPSVEASYAEITDRDHAWIRITACVYPLEAGEDHPFSLVVHFTHKGYPYKYRAYDSENMELKKGEWNRITFDYLTPEVRRKSDRLKVYFWNRGPGMVYIDDLKVEVWERK